MPHAKSSLRPIAFRILLLLAAAAMGCRSAGAPRTTDESPVRTTIDIQNQAFDDMTIYAIVSGARTRLGIAPGNRTTTLTIPAYLLNGTSFMRFVADPIGGNRTPVTEEVDVSPGDQLVLIINPGG
ncbi:MAG: hypothetical protein JJD97_03595 [Gemmatimonadaceae bacterium]|nr:hypothetical protein [Gemmatimonadaceae bacterium]